MSLETKIEQKLKDSNIKSNKKYKSLGWKIIILTLIVAIGIGMIDLVVTSDIPSFVALAVIIIGIIFSVRSFKQAKKISKSNQQILINIAPDLHQIYFESCRKFFPNGDFQFEGIFPSQIFNNNCFHFSWGEEKIVWDIDEDIETRRKNTININTGKKITKTVNVYILKISLVSTAKKLLDFDEIWISGGKAPQKNKKFFQSESIDFNNRFRVEGNNQMQIFKLFTPKIIDNFVKEKLNFLGTKKINLKRGKALITHWGIESPKSWLPDPLAFPPIRWNEKYMVNDIVKKLDLNFSRYLEIQELLKPLDLYEQ